MNFMCSLCIIVILQFNFVFSQESFCGTVNPSDLQIPTISYSPSLNKSVPVFFHVIISSNGSGDVSNSQLNNQITILNENFADGQDVTFYLVGISRTVNDNWRGIYEPTGNGPRQNETNMKNALAVDTDHVLNIYITDVNDATSVVAWALFPWDGRAEQNPKLHGVVIQPEHLPGGGDPYYNQGRLPVHEVGHYFGLLHTWTWRCSAGDGDGVLDTPIHLRNVDCDFDDSCELLFGVDPIDNHMNATNDVCRVKFTNGQYERMNQKIQEDRPNIGGTTINFTDDLAIPAGDSYELYTADFKFASGKKIVVNGTLNATNATFTSSSSSWLGIHFYSGSSGTIDGCTIEKAQGSGALIGFGASPTVKNSTFSNNSAVSVYVTNSHSTYLENNTIQNNTNSGVSLYNATIYMKNNTISAPKATYKEALNAINYSTVHFTAPGQSSSGNNTLKDSYQGIDAYYYTTFNAGNGTTKHNNSFLNNTFNAYATNNSTIYAENNWWSPNPPTATSYDGSSYIDWSPYNGPMMMVRNNEVHDENFNSLSSTIEGNNNSDNSKKAIADLGRLYASTKDKSIIDHIKSIKSNKSAENDARPIAMEVLSNIFMLDKNTSESVAVNKELLNDYKDTIHEKNALMNLFFAYYGIKDYKNAEKSLSRISKEYQLNEEVIFAKSLIGIDVNRITGNLNKPFNMNEESQTEILSNDFRLIGNSPNPFNPETRISYSIPEISNVKISIYDITGKLMKTFETNGQTAGIHNVNWDGTNEQGVKVSSGIYIYRMFANSLESNKNIVQSKKMIMLK